MARIKRRLNLVLRKSYTSWDWWALHLQYTQSFCRLTGTSRVKSFSSFQIVFLIIRMLLSNLFLSEPAQVSFLFRVPSLICRVFKCLNSLRFCFLSIIHIDDQLMIDDPVCSVIFIGAKYVWSTLPVTYVSYPLKQFFWFPFFNRYLTKK